MKPAFLILLVLTLALGAGSCARPWVVPPVAVKPPETPWCEVPQLQRELALCEDKLPTARAERTNLLVRAARLCFLLGELSPKEDKRQYFEKGRGYGETLAMEQPAWAEGHYWLALNLCGLAELGGPRRGLKLVPLIIEAMEQALQVNPAYDQAGPHRTLGRIYFECPAWPLSVGDLHKSLRHLTAAVTIAPQNSTNHLFLAETLFKLGKKAEAREELDQVLRATRHALCRQDLEQDRQDAMRLLGKHR